MFFDKHMLLFLCALYNEQINHTQFIEFGKMFTLNDCQFTTQYMHKKLYEKKPDNT